MLITLITLVVPIRAQSPQSTEIIFPAPNQQLFGLVSITGTASHPQFQRYKVEFSSEETVTPEWFLIGEVTQQVNNGPLAQWDTSQIPDGHYQLRLRVILRDGTVLQATVAGLVVSNQVPTALPTALQAATPLPPTAIPTEGPTPTSLIQQPPTNTPAPFSPTDTPDPAAAVVINPPAQEEPQQPLVVAFDAVRSAFCTGAFCSLGVFAVIGVYALFQSRIMPAVRRATGRIEYEE
ncbi:MAG: hypothetical protein KF726_25205 [Anaerolineae bacterium]|nr:hypothetical protein [Anaerolineae bacterium]